MVPGQPDLNSPVMSSKSKLKLGVFGMNASRGVTPTRGEGSLEHLNWQQQLSIAKAAEDAGLEAIIPIARYRGYKGESGWCHETYDTVPWAAGLGAATKRVQVFSTLHVPLNHPTRVAKELVTIDHVSAGRAAVNIVAGWNTDEFAMFGYQQREHNDRYAQAKEWVTILLSLWGSAGPIDFDGRFYSLQDVYSSPAPVQQPRPPIMNAGTSPAGRQFAATYADLCFVAAPDLEGLRTIGADIRERAGKLGRNVEIWTTTGVVCGETEADVKRRYDYFVHDTGDWAGAESAIRAVMAGGAVGVAKQIDRASMEAKITGSFGHRLVGTPEQIVESMQQLVDAGVNGVAANWFDYEQGIKMFHDLVVPLAEREGLRDPKRRVT